MSAAGKAMPAAREAMSPAAKSATLGQRGIAWESEREEASQPKIGSSGIA